MKDTLASKGLVWGIILLFVGVQLTTNISGNMSENKNPGIQSYQPSSANVTITDGTHDVVSIDYLTGETTVVDFSPYINVVNLDLTKATYTKQGIQVNLSLQVLGIIENRGKLIDFYSGGDIIDAVEYTFDLSTSNQDYSVSYCNETGRLYAGPEQINLTSSDFWVFGNTVSITFSLISEDEIYESLWVTATYILANLSNLTGLVYLSDVAPNPPLTISEMYAPDNGYVGEIIQFNASIEPLTGQPPYTYHWDFGDQGTSTALNPTHIYTKPENYTYTFTVTDSAGATASKSGNITIHGLKKTFIFGRYTNLHEDAGLITIETVHLWTLQFNHFELKKHTSPDTITFTRKWVGILTGTLIIGLFNITT